MMADPWWAGFEWGIGLSLAVFLVIFVFRA